MGPEHDTTLLCTSASCLAKKTAPTEAISDACRQPAVRRAPNGDVAAPALPVSVLYHVLRTQESVILDDAAAEPPFAADPYIRHHQAKSILCLPLITQTKLIGVLYLENNLTTRAFAAARVAMLKLLASQAAIALENARLYRDLAEREAKIRRLVDANIIGIFISRRPGRIVEANDAFLKIVGYDREDLAIGRLCWTNLTPRNGAIPPRAHWRSWIQPEQLKPMKRSICAYHQPLTGSTKSNTTVIG
jgi:GAF domain-containing protein